MRLNQNSTSARLFRWFYVTSEMPKNLCPYFWKLVLMWGFILPYTILSLPMLIFFRDRSSNVNLLGRPAGGLLVYLFLGQVFAMLFSISVFWIQFPKESIFSLFQALGITAWIAAILIGCIFLLRNIVIWLSDFKHRQKIMKKYDDNGNWIPPVDRIREKKPNIMVEFIKASYYKYCPSIEWTQEKTK